MSFEITGHKAGLEGSFIRTTAESATEALRMARQWAGQGIQGITISNPKGGSYDLDHFDMIASTKEEARAGCASSGRSRRSSRSSGRRLRAMHVPSGAKIWTPS